MSEKCSKQKSSAKSYTGELLGELYKNVSMGKQAILDIMPKVKDSKLSAELTAQLEEYNGFCEQLKTMLCACGAQAKEQGVITKISSKLGIEMNTLTDASDEHIAQMIVEGTTMGITDTIRAVRDYENSSCSEDALSLARKIVNFQEKSVEKIKKFL